MNSRNRFFLGLTGTFGAIAAGVVLGVPGVVAQVGEPDNNQPGTVQQQDETPTGQDSVQQQQQEDGLTQQQDNDNDQFAEEDDGVRALW
ncbi:hypothetical protein [Egbenema bharatensis]|uniref:hypothetical protein n=1 Tax=Egbenema bharatensis TaxID=3463334 RepID=UPI003A8A4C71